MTTFYAPALRVGEVELDADAAHHAVVKRMTVGDKVSVTDGKGSFGPGRVEVLDKKRGLVLSVDNLETAARPSPVHLYVPVADRDRMLWLAEKATELQVTSWTPVMYRRSRSVTPRGEGEAFEKKVLARMISALEQSGGAWLPDIRPMAEPAHLHDVIGDRYVFERGGARFASPETRGLATSLAVGPEGGFEAEELTGLRDSGWSVASLGEVTLRFETAAVAAVAIVRAA